MLGCRKTKTGGPPRLEAPTRHRLLTEVMIPERAIMPAGPHATVLETGDPSDMDRDRSGLAFQKAPSRRERPARRASRGFRSGNPRRRLLVGSKGVERIEISRVLGHRASWLKSRRKPSRIGKLVAA